MRKLLVAFICLFLAIPSQAETIIVDANGSTGYDNIQAAINVADHNDIIIVNPGTYQPDQDSAHPNDSGNGMDSYTTFRLISEGEVTVYYDYIENGQLKGGVATILLPQAELDVLATLAPEWSVTTLIDNGPPSNRVDLVFLGDGYTDSQLETYATHVQNVLDIFLAEEPLAAYASYFNVHRVDVVSNESGVDEPDNGIYRDTALDMTYNCSGIPRLLCVNVSKAFAAAGNAPDVDQILALANSSRYGGAGYPSADLSTLAAAHSAAVELALHEFGHSFADLADEYHYYDGTTYTGSEPSLPNISIYNADEQLALQTKWYRWLDLPNVDTFEGAYYRQYGIYRPTDHSKMNWLGEPFEEVNTEQFVISFYKVISPIDDATPPSQELLPDDDTTFFVTPMEPTDHLLDVQWSIDGANVPGATGLTFTPDLTSLPKGSHEVAVSVVDNTELVRDETARAAWLTDVRQWRIKGPIQAAIDASVDGDTIIVAEGTYHENINFNGKNITLTSTDLNDPAVVTATVIKGLGQDPVVTFSNGEDANCVLTGFTITGGNKGIYCSGASPTITNCIISGNRTKYSGGGIYCLESSPVITNCTFSGNWAGYDGGGMSNHYSSPTLANCIISGNSATNRGGGMLNVEGSPLVTNCTFSGNLASEGGGMYNLSNSEPNMTNCILWGNTAPSGPEIYNDGTSSATVSYSDVQASWPGEGNIDADPCFVGWVYREPVQGIISWWNFDEGTGTIAYDSAGNNHGTVYGAQWTTGYANGALSFDGVDDNVSLSPIDTLMGDTVTITAWVRCNNFGPTNYNPIVTQCDSAYNGYYLYFEDDQPVFWLSSGLGSAEAVSGDSVRPDEWCHIVGTYDGVDLKIYVNGSHKGSDSVTSLAGVNSYAYIGYDGHTAYPAYFSGIIDKVMIFDRALSDQEIRDLYLDTMRDYHLLPTSPCVDAGDNTAVPADTTDLDGDGDTTERIPFDLDGNPRILDGNNDGVPVVDMGAYEFNRPVEAAMKLAPQTLNCNSKGKWIKAHFVLPEGFLPEDVDVNEPAVAKLTEMDIESEYIKLLGRDKGLVKLEVAFDREAFCAFCDSITDDSPLDITVVGSLTSGQYFYGSDTIRIITSRRR